MKHHVDKNHSVFAKAEIGVDVRLTSVIMSVVKVKHTTFAHDCHASQVSSNFDQCTPNAATKVGLQIRAGEHL